MMLVAGSLDAVAIPPVVSFNLFFFTACDGHLFFREAGFSRAI